MTWRAPGRLAVALAVASLAVGACSSAATPAPTSAPASAAPTSAAPSAAKTYTIGSVIWNTSIPFYTNLIKGEKDGAAKYGMNIDLQNGNGDLSGQIAVIQQFIAKKVDLILVSPSDPEGIAPVIKQANDAGIPVISVNSTVGKSAQVVTYVGADDYEFGQKQGEMLAKAFPNGASVGYILGHLGVSAQTLREQGLMDYLNNYPNIKIITKQSADWDNAKALAITQDWLNKYPKGSIDAIVDQGPEGATGAKYAYDNGRPEIKFMMGDYPADVKTGIEAGYIYGTVDQDPYPQGTTAVDMAYYWLTGQKDKVPTPQLYLPLPIVTKDNVSQYPAAWGG